MKTRIHIPNDLYLLLVRLWHFLVVLPNSPKYLHLQ